MFGIYRMKKGEFALTNVTGLLLILLAALILILFVYLLRDKMTEIIDIIKGLFGL